LANLAISRFNNGEVSPYIDALSDVEKYKSSCRKLENMIPLVYGPAERRPGTKYIATGKNTPEGIRLIPFIYSADIAYMCEFGNGYARFYYDDELLTSGGSAVEVVTPYTSAHLSQVQYKQIGDVLWLVHPSYAPRKLSRTTATTFDLSEIVFEKGPFLTRNDLANDDDVTMQASVIVTDTTGTLTSTVETFKAGHVGSLFQLTHPRENVVSSLDITSANNSTAIDVKGSWTFNTHGTWNATVLIQRNEDSAGWETYRTYIGPDRNITLSAIEDFNNVQYRISVSSYTSHDGDPGADITVNDSTQDGVVRIDSLVSGLIANVTVLSAIASTDATKRWAEGAWSDVRGYPSTVAKFESRIIYGGTANNAQTLWLSETDDYENFEAGTKDADSFSLVLTTTNDIQWINSLEAIIVGTSGTEWQVSSTKLNVPITPTNFAAREQTTHGSKDIQALRVNNSILFVDRVGRKVRELTYSDSEYAYSAPDLTMYAEHITEGGISGIAYQKNPTATIWAVRADGTLLSMSYERAQGVVGWARHLTGETHRDVTTSGIEYPGGTDSYKLSYFIDHSELQGIPINYADMTISGLTGSAVEVSAGVVALPMVSHPFSMGQTIRITGTTNYSGADYVLLGGTTADELHISSAYTAETFADNTVIQVLTTTTSSVNRLVQDSSGTLFMAGGIVHTTGTGADTARIGMITNRGRTEDDTFFIRDGGWAGFEVVIDLAVSSDSKYLYAYYAANRDEAPPISHRVAKFQISDGAMLWEVVVNPARSSTMGWDITLDQDDNVYVLNAVSLNNTYVVLGAEDGAEIGGGGPSDDSEINLSFTITLDNEGLVYVGGRGQDDTTDDVVNIYSSSLSQPVINRAALGGVAYVGGAVKRYRTGTIPRNGILPLNGFVFAVSSNTALSEMRLYKLTSTLTTVTSVSVPITSKSLFLGLNGNIVLVSQSEASAQTIVFYFYDEDLNLLGSIGGLNSSTLFSWGQAEIISPFDFNYFFGSAPDTANFWRGVIPRYASTTTELTEYGFVTSIAVIPGTTEDEIWMSILRNVDNESVMFIEKMTARAFDTQDDCFYVDCGVIYDGDATTTIEGLGHLESETVAILGDGAVFPTQVVSGGTVTLTEAVSKASVGLPYRYTLEPMRFDVTQGPTTTLGSIKRVSELVFSFMNSLGVTYGKSEDDLDIIKWRTDEVYGSPPALFTGEKKVPFSGGYTIDDPLFVSGADPLPCTLRAIVARVEKTGR